MIFKEEMVGGRKSVTTDKERVARRLKREKVVKIDRLSGCKNFVGVREWEKEREREKFTRIFDAFVDLYG